MTHMKYQHLQRLLLVEMKQIHGSVEAIVTQAKSNESIGQQARHSSNRLDKEMSNLAGLLAQFRT